MASAIDYSVYLVTGRELVPPDLVSTMGVVRSIYVTRTMLTEITLKSGLLYLLRRGSVFTIRSNFGHLNHMLQVIERRCNNRPNPRKEL